MTGVLSVRDMSIRFGGLQALDGVDLEVGEWEIVGIIGPNGAGKTTLFNCVTGIYRPDRGTVSYRGEDITTLPTHRRAALGIGRTWQNLGLDRSLTVMDNLLTAQHHHVRYQALTGILGGPASFAEEGEVRQNAEEILSFLGLLPLAREVVGGLPYGTQKVCDLAMALATDPDLLLLDEPSSGMGPQEAHRLGETLRFLRDSLNLTIVMIEHHVPLVVGVCDYVYCFNFGRLLTSGKPQQVQRHPEVVAAYLGEDAVDTGASPGESRPPQDSPRSSSERADAPA